MTGRRRYLVRGRLRMPFAGYERRSRTSTSEPDAWGGDASDRVGVFGSEHGLTPAQQRIAECLLGRADRHRSRLTGPRFAARIGGIISAVKRGLVGNSAWGRKMLAHRGGRTMALHALHHLRAIAPAGVRASVIARERRKLRGRIGNKRDP